MCGLIGGQLLIIRVVLNYNVQFQKISIPPPPTAEGIGISWGVGGSVRPRNLKKCMKLNRNFQRGGGRLRKIPFRGGGIDIFCNYTTEYGDGLGEV